MNRAADIDNIPRTFSTSQGRPILFCSLSKVKIGNDEWKYISSSLTVISTKSTFKIFTQNLALK